MDDVVEGLTRLQQLLDAGTISHDEFLTLKADLIARHTPTSSQAPSTTSTTGNWPTPNSLPDPGVAPIPPPPPPPMGFGIPSAPLGTVPPPTSSPKNGSKGLIIGLGVAALCAVVAVVLVVTRDSWLGRGQITVNYTLEVVTDSYCADFAGTGYDDIPFAEAELFDGSGTLLGFGRLDGGVDTDTSCVFTASFTADATSDGSYRITAGNGNRGFLNYTTGDVIDGVLTVDAVIE
jgi:hypothetical protein